MELKNPSSGPHLHQVLQKIGSFAFRAATKLLIGSRKHAAIISYTTIMTLKDLNIFKHLELFCNCGGQEFNKCQQSPENVPIFGSCLSELHHEFLYWWHNPLHILFVLHLHLQYLQWLTVTWLRLRSFKPPPCSYSKCSGSGCKQPWNSKCMSVGLSTG